MVVHVGDEEGRVGDGGVRGFVQTICGLHFSQLFLQHGQISILQGGRRGGFE